MRCRRAAADRLLSAWAETIANLIIDSPSGGNTIQRDANGKLTVSDTVTFQGAAATVTFDDTQATPSGEALVAGNMIFTGSSPWTIQGDALVRMNGGTISNDVDVTISTPFTNNFTKVGSGTLTLGDPRISGGIILSNSVLVFATNANFSASEYVELIGSESTFTADYGGTFPNIAAVNAGIGPAGYFRPRAGAKDNGSSFTVAAPPSGTIIRIR